MAAIDFIYAWQKLFLVLVFRSVYTTSTVTQFYFLAKECLIYNISTRTEKVSKKYLNIGRYLGLALNGLSLL